MIVRVLNFVYSNAGISTVYVVFTNDPFPCPRHRPGAGQGHAYPDTYHSCLNMTKTINLYLGYCLDSIIYIRNPKGIPSEIFLKSLIYNAPNIALS